MKTHVGACACALDDNKRIWLSDYACDELWRYDISSRELCYICDFQIPNGEEHNYHLSAFVYDKSVFFFPAWGNIIQKYDFEHNCLISLYI